MQRSLIPDISCRQIGLDNFLHFMHYKCRPTTTILSNPCVKPLKHMQNLNFSIQNITAGQGIELAIAGMLIVFTVLLLITVFIALLPRGLAVLARKYPEREMPHSASDPTGSSTDNKAILAAIGYVLHARMQGKA